MSKRLRDELQRLALLAEDEDDDGPFTFGVGTRVMKANGYPFVGLVEAVWMARQADGTHVERLVVNKMEQLAPDDEAVPTGLSHIFAPEQLMLAAIPPPAYMPPAAARPAEEKEQEVEARLAYTVKELATMCGCAESALHKAIRYGKLKSFWLGKRRVVLLDDAEAFLKTKLHDGALRRKGAEERE